MTLPCRVDEMTPREFAIFKAALEEGSRIEHERASEQMVALRQQAFRLDSLVGQLVRLFDWSDQTYIHAAMHIENAVNNLRADLGVERHRAEQAERALAEKDAELRQVLAGVKSLA